MNSYKRIATHHMMQPEKHQETCYSAVGIRQISQSWDPSWWVQGENWKNKPLVKTISIHVEIFYLRTSNEENQRSDEEELNVVITDVDSVENPAADEVENEVDTVTEEGDVASEVNERR